MAAVLPVRLQAVDDAVALQHADGVAVEGRIEDGDAAFDLAVVVDRLDALLQCGLLDRGSGAGVDRRDDQDLRAGGDALVGLRLLLLRVALSVDDSRGDMGRLERLLERRLVELLPAHRRLRVRHQATSQDAGRSLRRPGRRDRDGDGEPGDRGRKPDGGRLPRNTLHLVLLPSYSDRSSGSDEGAEGSVSHFVVCVKWLGCAR